MEEWMLLMVDAIGAGLGWLRDFFGPIFGVSKREAQVHALGQADDGGTVGIRLGDTLRVKLPLHPEPDVKARLVGANSEDLGVRWEVNDSGSYRARCRPVRSGSMKLEVQYRREDGAVLSTWRVNLSVADKAHVA